MQRCVLFISFVRITGLTVSILLFNWLSRFLKNVLEIHRIILIVSFDQKTFLTSVLNVNVQIWHENLSRFQIALKSFQIHFSNRTIILSSSSLIDFLFQISIEIGFRLLIVEQLGQFDDSALRFGLDLFHIIVVKFKFRLANALWLDSVLSVEIFDEIFGLFFVQKLIACQISWCNFRADRITNARYEYVPNNRLLFQLFLVLIAMSGQAVLTILLAYLSCQLCG